MSNLIENKLARYIHPYLSWLEFNNRVLAEAADIKNPLLERVKFMAIYANNLDEFYMVRVASLKRLVDSKYNKRDRFGWLPTDLYKQITARIREQRDVLYKVYSGDIKKDMVSHNILIKDFTEQDVEQQLYSRRYFENAIFPVITPLAIDQGRPFPVLPSKTMSYAVSLKKNGKTHLAIIPIPRILPRLLRLPSEQNEYHYILLETLFKNYAGICFKGYRIEDIAKFRIIRDSELDIDEDLSSDLLKSIEKEIKRRPQAKIVSLEIEQGTSPQMCELIASHLQFVPEDICVLPGDMDLTYLFELAGQVNEPGLFYNYFEPASVEFDNIFDLLKNEDVLLHLPFQSFNPTIDFLNAAASDKNVLAIKITIYRTDKDSAIIKALEKAASNGKQVTALVEIKARFDEEANIRWTRDLESAGCHVIYGIAGMKVHAKMTLVIRKEEDRIRRYVHLSTGNYNEKTAQLYTDIGYFTSNDDFGRDISDLFNVITGFSIPTKWTRVISSPYNLKKYFFELVDREINFHKQHKNGLIFAKMNSLEDIEIIEKLYEASNAGVKIKLLVRGICTLVPGVPGLSENIKVKSIVGRFLEHSRIFIFNNNTDRRYFLSSADWMSRNLDRRIEHLFEISKQNLKEQIDLIMDQYWKNNRKSWVLSSDHSYHKLEKTKSSNNIHDFFIDHYSANT